MFCCCCCLVAATSAAVVVVLLLLLLLLLSILTLTECFAYWQLQFFPYRCHWSFTLQTSTCSKCSCSHPYKKDKNWPHYSNLKRLELAPVSERIKIISMDWHQSPPSYYILFRTNLFVLFCSSDTHLLAISARSSQNFFYTRSEITPFQLLLLLFGIQALDIRCCDSLHSF